MQRQQDEKSVLGAVVDVLDAGQRVLLDRIALATLEARAAFANGLASLVLVLFGLAFLLVGWVAANAVGIVILARSRTHAEAFALISAVNLLAGVIALLLARRRGQAITGEDAARPGRPDGVADGGTIA